MGRRSIGLLALALACSSSDEAGSPPLTGSAGTRDGHWRESVFGTELMTGWVTRGSNPLSALTIASLVDLGYGANSSAASGYVLSSYSGGMLGVQVGGREIMKRPKFRIDRRGQKRPF